MSEFVPCPAAALAKEFADVRRAVDSLRKGRCPEHGLTPEFVSKTLHQRGRVLEKLAGLSPATSLKGATFQLLSCLNVLAGVTDFSPSEVVPPHIRERQQDSIDTAERIINSVLAVLLEKGGNDPDLAVLAEYFDAGDDYDVNRIAHFRIREVANAGA